VTLSPRGFWNDRRGQFSPLRAATLIALALPALAILYFAVTNQLGPRPFTEAIHQAGLWTIRFLMLSLFITPLRRLARWPKLLDIRRMIGVAAFFYIALHFSLYIGDQAFNFLKVASEIVSRIYLTIGFVALSGLALLAATSTDAMVRRLGPNWRKVHWLVYPIATLGLVHYFMQAKLEIFQPTVVAGLFVWMMLYRIVHWTMPDLRRKSGEIPVWAIALLGIISAGLTFFGEAFGLYLARSIDPMLVLAPNFDPEFNWEFGVRPGWYVFAAGLIVTLIAAVRRQRPQPASSAG